VEDGKLKNVATAHSPVYIRRMGVMPVWQKEYNNINNSILNMFCIRKINVIFVTDLI